MIDYGKTFARGQRILVCGGRDFGDLVEKGHRDYEARSRGYALVWRVLDDLAPSLVLQGGARGADHAAKCWALRHGAGLLEAPAPWAHFGDAAGPRRNAFMAKLVPMLGITIVVAFPGGSGTADMVRRAEALSLVGLSILRPTVDEQAG